MEAQTIILDSSTVPLAAIASRRILTPHRGSGREFCLVEVQLTQATGLRCRANLRALTLCVREKVSRSRMHHRPRPRVCTEEALCRGCSQADREDLGVCCTRSRWLTRCVTLCLWEVLRAGGTSALRARRGAEAFHTGGRACISRRKCVRRPAAGGALLTPFLLPV